MGTQIKISGLGSVMNLSQICLKVLPRLLCAMVIIYAAILLLFFNKYIMQPVIYDLHISSSSSLGDRVLFSCSGIIVKCQEHLTRLVTSASLVIAFTDAKKKHHNLKVGADDCALLFLFFFT